MKHFIITKASGGEYGTKAATREQLDARLARHALLFPNAAPPVAIREGNIVGEWIKEGAKEKKLYEQTKKAGIKVEQVNKATTPKHI